MSIKINDLALVFYTQKQKDAIRLLYEAHKYLHIHQVTQIIVIYNGSKKLPEPIKVHKNILFLETKEDLTQGAALNKALPHLWARYSLLIDSTVLFSIDSLKVILSYRLPFLHRVFVNIPGSNHYQSPYHSYQSRNIWPKYNISLVSFLSWGAIIFDNNFVFTLGGFDEHLSYDDLMVDISMRSHQRQATIVELNNIEPLKSCPNHSQSRVNSVLWEKYFVSHPSLWKRFIHWINSFSDNKKPYKKTSFKKSSVMNEAEMKVH